MLALYSLRLTGLSCMITRLGSLWAFDVSRLFKDARMLAKWFVVTMLKQSPSWLLIPEQSLISTSKLVCVSMFYGT